MQGAARRGMLLLSRSTFVRMIAGAAGAAILSDLGCGDASPSDMRRGANSPSGSTNPTEPEGSNDPSDALADAAADATEAPVDAAMDATVDGGTDGGGQSDAETNACKQALMLTNANGGITSGHVHAFTIPVADFTSATNKTYTMSGGHAHTVTLTPAQFTMLRAGQTVSVTSSNTNNHTHACTIKCV
jgi:hypothetical protein